MAKLQRKSAKVFAEQAQAAVGGIAQFGSLAAGDIQYSKDVDVIQALDAYKEGWSSAVIGNKSPAMEDRNALDYLLSYQQAYIMQQGVPEWLSTETYYKNAYVVDTNGDLRFSRIDNNVGHNPTDDISGQQYWGFGGSKGTGKNIGEVYFSQSKLATDNVGALPLFTGDLITNANTVYPQFYSWLQNHPEICKTQAEYDTAISTYGECPYYVLNSTSFRLPKLVNYLKMANSTNGVTQSGAGLPNITGKVDGSSQDVHAQSLGEIAQSKAQVTGAFAGIFGTQDSVQDYAGGSMLRGFTFDASRSNSIYGNSNTVTPAHTTVYPWVCVYNAAVPASTAQAAEFLQGLLNKADVDLSNLTSAGLAKFVGRTFTPLDVLIAQGGGSIAGSYTLTDLPDDGVTRLALFSFALHLTQNGGSSMDIETDVSGTRNLVAVTNNSFTAGTTIFLPVKRQITISFPATGGGIGTSTNIRLKGYL